MEQWLTLHNQSTAQGHWKLHQLLFLPQAAPEQRQHNPYDTHPERPGTQSFPQPPPPALRQGQGQQALLQGPPLNATTAVQQRGRRDTDGAEADCRNCQVAACTAACRHLTRDTKGLRPYKPADRTVLATEEAALTMGLVAAWLAHLPSRIPCLSARPCQPAVIHAPTAPLTAEQLYAVAAALLAECGESFVHLHGAMQITSSIQGP